MVKNIDNDIKESFFDSYFKCIENNCATNVINVLVKISWDKIVLFKYQKIYFQIQTSLREIYKVFEINY